MGLRECRDGAGGTGTGLEAHRMKLRQRADQERRSGEQLNFRICPSLRSGSWHLVFCVHQAVAEACVKEPGTDR